MRCACEYPLVSQNIPQIEWLRFREMKEPDWFSNPEKRGNSGLSNSASSFSTPSVLERRLVKFHSSHLIKSPWKLTLDFYDPRQNDKWREGNRNHPLIIFKAIRYTQMIFWVEVAALLEGSLRSGWIMSITITIKQRNQGPCGEGWWGPWHSQKFIFNGGH